MVLKSKPLLLNCITLLLIYCCFVTVAHSQSKGKLNNKNNTNNSPKNNSIIDTSKVKNAKVINDTATLASDSLKNDSLSKEKPKKDIETTIKYAAEDSIVLDADDRTAFLYKESKVIYGNKEIAAHSIDMDYKTNVIKAIYITDSLDKKVGVPVFKEGNDTYEAGQIKYNYKTRRGQVKEIITKQGDGVIHGKVVKKEPNNDMFVEDAIYTTCNLREPHFCIKAVALKMIPKKKIVTRAFNLQIADIPTPIAFPFAVFPMPKKRGSGLIFPSYGESQTRGFFLTNGGFFWAVNNYVGLKLLADIYTTGGGRFSLNADYKSRYSFTGFMNLSYSDVVSFPNDPSQYSKADQYWVSWTHSTLSKGTGRFSASVNAGSPQYIKSTSFNVAARQTANFASSISYSNSIKKTPFVYSLNARQNQNNATGAMLFNLPQANLSMSRIYPLKNVPGINKFDVIKKLQFSYSGSFDNSISTTHNNINPGYPIYGVTSIAGNSYQPDTAFSRKYYKTDTLSPQRFLKDFGKYSQWTATHTVPISTSFKLFKWFTFTPNANYTETWHKNAYKFDTLHKAVKVDTLTSFSSGGLARSYKYSGGISTTTRIYGTFFIRKGIFEALRHTLVPTIGYTYTPNFSRSFTEGVVIDTGHTGSRKYYFDRFTGALVTDNSVLKASNLISFSLANTLELKIKDTKDTVKTSYKKISLLDNFNIASAYNISADSFKLSNFSVTARTNILKKYNVNFVSNFDPYYYNFHSVDPSTGHTELVRSKYYAFNHHPHDQVNSSNTGFMSSQGLGRFTTMSISITTRFAPTSKGRKVQSVNSGTDYQFMARSYYPLYVDWTLPWSLSINYNLNYSKYTSIGYYLLDKSSFKNIVSFNGDFSVTSKWKVQYTSGYDVLSNAFSNTVLTINRDLHCWYASLSWGVYPVSFQYFIATIGIKSSSLHDVKIPRRSVPFRDQ